MGPDLFVAPPSLEADTCLFSLRLLLKWKEQKLGPTIKTLDYVPFLHFSLPFSFSCLSTCNSPIWNKTPKSSSIATYVIYCTFLITPWGGRHELQPSALKKIILSRPPIPSLTHRHIWSVNDVCSPLQALQITSPQIVLHPSLSHTKVFS